MWMKNLPGRPLTPASRKISGDRSAVSEPLYRQIKDRAKQSRTTMSETMAGLLSRAFEWQETFAEPEAPSAELLERQKEDLKKDLIAECCDGRAGGRSSGRRTGRRLRWRRARARERLYRGEKGRSD